MWPTEQGGAVKAGRGGETAIINKNAETSNLADAAGSGGRRFGQVYLHCS